MKNNIAANKVFSWVFFFILTLLPSAILAANEDIAFAIGQMMMVGFNGTDINEHSPIVQAMKKYHIGGVLLVDHYTENGKKITRNIKNPTQLKNLTNKLQYYSKKYTGLPLFIAVNQEGGEINSLKSSKGFPNAHDPSQAQLGKTKNTKIIFNTTYRRALLLKEMGINVDLAPVADLDINPNNPAVGELERSFGKNPEQVTKDLKAAVKAYKKAKILCAIKHFPGIGSADANTDYNTADVSKTWQSSELIPYEKLIKANQICTFIMTSHAINRRLDARGVPASFSKKMVTDLLVNKFHFDGLIITDDMDAKAITQNFNFNDAITQVVLAGNHVIIYDGTQGHVPLDDIVQLYTTLMQLSKSNPEIRHKILLADKKIKQVKQGMND